MKAISSRRGRSPDNLKVLDLAKPVPRRNEVLVAVSFASVTRGDVLLRTIPRPILLVLGGLFGFKPMDIPGVEFAGTVMEKGADVGAWQVGDRVAGTTTGLRYGANAEYVCVPSQSSGGVLVGIPDGVTDRDAAATVVGGMTGMQILNRVQPVKGRTVLVYGCSGSVGSLVAQIARSMGAVVTGVCGTESRGRVADLGMSRVLDYNEDSWRSEKADVVIDAVGKLTRRQVRALLEPGGRFGSVRRPTREVREELAGVLRLLESGEITPLIDREISLDEVAAAHAYVATGRKKGNIVVKVASASHEAANRVVSRPRDRATARRAAT